MGEMFLPSGKACAPMPGHGRTPFHVFCAACNSIPLQEGKGKYFFFVFYKKKDVCYIWGETQKPAVFFKKQFAAPT